ncbi:MAG: hypothetical protein MR598_03110 [Erysipelotrichaceae bacterium]|nr:hypothetical protein [Erysipelotrichaceae bacterium]
MSKLKLKLNNKGYLDEFTLNGKKLGENITKLTLIMEPNTSNEPKLILEYMGETEIEGNIEIEKKKVKQS